MSDQCNKCGGEAEHDEETCIICRYMTLLDCTDCGKSYWKDEYKDDDDGLCGPCWGKAQPDETCGMSSEQIGALIAEANNEAGGWLWITAGMPFEDKTVYFYATKYDAESEAYSAHRLDKPLAHDCTANFFLKNPVDMCPVCGECGNAYTIDTDPPINGLCPECVEATA